MSNDAKDDWLPDAAADAHASPQPQIHIHNAHGGGKGWNILVTLLLVAGGTAIGYHLSQGPMADDVATGMTVMLSTLVTSMFKAGILRMPEKEGDDLAFTKSALRRIYDELTEAVVNSSVLRLVMFAVVHAVAFLLLRAVIAFGFGLLSSMWMAIGVGLLLGGAVVAQEQIWARLRQLNAKKGNHKS